MSRLVENPAQIPLPLITPNKRGDDRSAGVVFAGDRAFIEIRNKDGMQEKLVPFDPTKDRQPQIDEALKQ